MQNFFYWAVGILWVIIHSTMLWNNTPAMPPPLAGSPSLFRLTMMLYLGASAGKYPQKDSRYSSTEESWPKS
jgi:hypothetical protein